MEKLYVYADFDWLKDPELVGQISYEFVRGAQSFSFKFDDKWLVNHSNLSLSADLNNYPRMQYNINNKGLFGCFTDVLPERWGRTLLKRKEQIVAQEENRQVRTLSDFDYLVGVDDFSRLGAFRFKKDKEGAFINTDSNLRVPPVENLSELAFACNEIEKTEANHLLPDKKWLMQLIKPGSSLGGARPKATVVDDSNTLYVAKFPSRNDDYDVALWEHFCHLLAQKAGINSALTKTVSLGGNYHTLLSRRFDRNTLGKRIHFASAMSLLGLSDGDNAQTGHGYLDIVDFIVQECADVENNLKELYRRVAFNICVGNSDDHFRNHGFLLTPKGWILSPAYDMNPTVDECQSLLISRDDNKADLNILLKAAKDYMLSHDGALKIISSVIDVIKGWKITALKLGLGKRDMDLFGKVFEERIKL